MSTKKTKIIFTVCGLMVTCASMIMILPVVRSIWLDVDFSVGIKSVLILTFFGLLICTTMLGFVPLAICMKEENK